jgi:AICAR transformylase/IMP cyclohydrolase PurH
MPTIERALLSVYDKTFILPFAETVAAANVQSASTAGAAGAPRVA